MTEKFYLGISLGFNSSACVVSNKRGLLSAVSQERLNGVKNTKEIPFNAMLECLKIANVKEVDRVCISHYETITDEYFHKYSSCELVGSDWKEFIINFLTANYIFVKNDTVYRVDHHTAHQYSTFGFYGMPKGNDYYMISSDGFGDGLSAKIHYSKEGTLSTVKLENSIGLIYQFVTGALGFKEHQHEGKITGLAAFGKPIYKQDILNHFKRVHTGNGLSFVNEEFLSRPEMTTVLKSNIIDFDKFLLLRKTIYNLVADLIIDGANKEDIAASVQEFAEETTVNWLKAHCLDKGDAYLSGGLFANVKINQRIKDSGLFNNVYVCPAMGDEGTAVGSAIYTAYIEDGYYCDNVNKVGPSEKVISGTCVKDNKRTRDMICKELVNMNLHGKYKVSYVQNSSKVIDIIVENLANNKIVCLMRDEMEFGPRALCHRSILYNATQKETNDSLNARLSRSEFMPFAPVCRKEVAEDLFKNLDGGRDSAQFMTMTFDGTDEFVGTYKAVAHIDGTARPQIVSKDNDKFMWKLLTEYEAKTNLKCLVNTSFNLHEQPIICKALTGLHSFTKADLDVLVIGNVIIEKI